MKFAKALVLVNGILFIGFGLGFILAPVFFSTQIRGQSPFRWRFLVELEDSKT